MNRILELSRRCWSSDLSREWGMIEEGVPTALTLLSHRGTEFGLGSRNVWFYGNSTNFFIY